MKFIPRAGQKKVLEYQKGSMGISAVPGSGKTHVLSALAAQLVRRQLETRPFCSPGEPEPEILIVTFSNAAATNFATRIAAFLQDMDLIPGIGYHVCTLHSMAANIVRGRAELVGLEQDFSIIDEDQQFIFLSRAVAAWLEKDGNDTYDLYFRSDYSESSHDINRKEKWQKDLTGLLKNIISQAKDYQLTPEAIYQAAERVYAPGDCALLRMVSDIYSTYQSMLRLLPAADYADLMFFAAKILANDPAYLSYLQQRWPYILEDEAQDSSMIQETVLRLLTAKNGNWVRVGDPNQAINETFTTADPKFLKNFLKEADATVDLEEAGRSSRSILRQANRLIQWVSLSHPNPDCRSALVEPYIKVTAYNDVQPNPKDEPARVVFDPTKYRPAEEIAAVCKLAAEHARLRPEETIAILVPQNEFGAQISTELENYPVETVEVLKSSRKSRNAAEMLSGILLWLSMPSSARYCRNLFAMLYHAKAEKDFYLNLDDQTSAMECLKNISNMEDFFFPSSPNVFAQLIQRQPISDIVLHSLIAFRFISLRWLEARFLPIDQLILMIAQDLFEAPEDLCAAAQLGIILSRQARTNPELRLTDLAMNIKEIASKASDYPGLRDIDAQFDPDLYRGKIVITTFHKAKGLEWDQVYLTSLNTYDFPSGIMDEKTTRNKARPYYLRDDLDLQAETLELIKIAAFPQDGEIYREGIGSAQMRVSASAERLRLFFVGITRAKKGLHMSWNSGKHNNVVITPALQALVEISRKGKSSQS